jgi:hypothetical protein
MAGLLDAFPTHPYGPCMSMCKNGMFGGQDPNKRASNPDGWVHVVTQPAIEFKFHHVISWDCLRDTWQALLEYGQWNALEAFIHAVGVTGASAIRGKLRRDEDLDQVTLDMLFEKISWPGWNIVQGPGNRSDEGGREIDLFYDGMEAIDKERHSTLGLLWIAMEKFLDRVDRTAMRKRREEARGSDRPDVVTADYDAEVYDAAARLGQAFGRMAKFKTASYIPYTHSMWDTVSAGAVNKQATGLWDAVPQFRKTRLVRKVIGNMPPKMRCARCTKVYVRPNVPPGTKIWCEHCHKQTLVDFVNAA